MCLYNWTPFKNIHNHIDILMVARHPTTHVGPHSSVVTNLLKVQIMAENKWSLCFSTWWNKAYAVKSPFIMVADVQWTNENHHLFWTTDNALAQAAAPILWKWQYPLKTTTYGITFAESIHGTWQYFLELYKLIIHTYNNLSYLVQRKAIYFVMNRTTSVAEW